MPVYPSPVVNKYGQIVPSAQSNPFGGPMPPIGGPANFNGLPSPSPPIGGGGNGGGILNDISDIIGDVQDLLDDIGIGGGGGGNGSGLPLVDPSDLPSSKGDQLNAAFASAPGLKERFIQFLQAAGVYITWLNNFINTPVPNWPVYVIDLAIFWLKNSAPATQADPTFGTVADYVPENLATPGNLPVPAPGGGGLAQLGGFLPPVVATQVKTVLKVPRGYVIVTDPMTGQKVGLLKNVAKAAGLYKERVKAPITGSDWRAMKKAKRLQAKLAKMAKDTCDTYKVTKARCR